jgi:hypothetical protein
VILTVEIFKSCSTKLRRKFWFEKFLQTTFSLNSSALKRKKKGIFLVLTSIFLSKATHGRTSVGFVMTLIKYYPYTAINSPLYKTYALFLKLEQVERGLIKARREARLELWADQTGITGPEERSTDSPSLAYVPCLSHRLAEKEVTQ